MTHFSTPFPPAPGARVLSLGGYQPANVVTNDDLAARVDTSDEWIRSRVGIVSRRYAGPEETVTDMAVAAPWPAEIIEGLAEDGDPVSEGQPLVRIQQLREGT